VATQRAAMTHAYDRTTSGVSTAVAAAFFAAFVFDHRLGIRFQCPLVGLFYRGCRARVSNRSSLARRERSARNRPARQLPRPARSDVARLLAAADIHCQPNIGPEPFGITFIEALYAGLPLVTTSIGGAIEMSTARAEC
jgi:glycosyltransferase involved in cell wall biosynthesis